MLRKDGPAKERFAEKNEGDGTRRCGFRNFCIIEFLVFYLSWRSGIHVLGRKWNYVDLPNDYDAYEQGGC